MPMGVSSGNFQVTGSVSNAPTVGQVQTTTDTPKDCGLTGNTVSQLSPGSLKRSRADSLNEVGDDCATGCKRQRSGEGEMKIECCMASLTLGKRKASMSETSVNLKRQRSDDGEFNAGGRTASTPGKRKASMSEAETSLKKLKISSPEKVSVQQQKKTTTSWDSMDEGVTWATKTGKLHGPWNYKQLSWTSVGEGANWQIRKCGECGWFVDETQRCARGCRPS